MAPKLYYSTISPPCNTVRMVATALHIDLDLYEIRLRKGEHRTHEFIKKNPQHTIPTLDDDGYILWESHAIILYLIEKSGKNELYPTHIQQRATIQQRLHFDSGVLFAKYRQLFYPILYSAGKVVPDVIIADIQEAYSFLDAFLGDKQWMAGNNFSIADICLVSTFASVCEIVPLDADKHPRVAEWYNRCRKLPYFIEDQLADVLKDLIDQN